MAVNSSSYDNSLANHLFEAFFRGRPFHPEPSEMLLQFITVLMVFAADLKVFAPFSVGIPF